ncbi:hypothetical protein Ciccas_002290 [Cichlidogyrus casuarinus]|uniref:Uncharacterized protein n=1 Tax=Cichlidogyrus casuarinus TaxID=1844966 RepID=A0ABD2QHV6_9PLAT
MGGFNNSSNNTEDCITVRNSIIEELFHESASSASDQKLSGETTKISPVARDTMESLLSDGNSNSFAKSIAENV